MSCSPNSSPSREHRPRGRGSCAPTFRHFERYLSSLNERQRLLFCLIIRGRTSRDVLREAYDLVLRTKNLEAEIYELQHHKELRWLQNDACCFDIATTGEHRVAA